MKKLLALAFLLSTPLAASTWYGSPSGSGALCTLVAPCSMPFLAGGGTGGTQVQPGDTIYFRVNAGHYVRPQSGGVYQSITWTIKGTAVAPIVVKPYPPDQTNPFQSLIQIECDCGVQNPGGDCLDIRSNYVDYVQFEVAWFGDIMREAITGQWDSPGFGTGMRINADQANTYGDGNRFIGWVVHDTADNMFKSGYASPTSYIDNVHYNWGMRYNLPPGTPGFPNGFHRMGGHAHYTRNGIAPGCPVVDDPPGLFLFENVITGASLMVPGETSTASLGLQSYGSCSCEVMHRNETYRNAFIGAGMVNGGCSVQSDYTLGSRDQVYDGIWFNPSLGYFDAGCNNVTLKNSTFLRSMYAATDQYYATRSAIYITQSRGTETNPCRAGIIDGGGNYYWGNLNLVDSGTTDDDISGFKSSWFPGFTYQNPNSTPPSVNRTQVSPSPYFAGRCNVYIANFTNSTAQNVNLTACGLANNTTYAVYTMYDPLGAAYLTGTYLSASPTVSFPMTQAAMPRADSVGHGATTGGPNSWPEAGYSLPSSTSTNVYKAAFIVVQTSGIAPTPTNTGTGTATFTATRTSTFTPSLTNTNTPSNTPTFTPSFTPSQSPTNTNTPSQSPTNTFTPSHTATATFTLTPTRTFTPSPTPSQFGLLVQMSDCTVVAPMGTTVDATVYGGDYVSSAVQDTGTVTCTFRVPITGTWYAWAYTKGADAAHDSYWVGSNGASDATHIFDTRETLRATGDPLQPCEKTTITDTWYWVPINDRGTTFEGCGGTGIPGPIRPFSLTAGIDQTISIRQRDPGTPIAAIAWSQNPVDPPTPIISTPTPSPTAVANPTMCAYRHVCKINGVPREISFLELCTLGNHNHLPTCGPSY